MVGTGKSLSEALLFAEHGENMLCTKIVLNVRNNFCTQHVFPRFELGVFMYWTCNSMNNLSSYCGLVDAKIRASDRDLLVIDMKMSRGWLFIICSFCITGKSLSEAIIFPVIKYEEKLPLPADFRSYQLHSRAYPTALL